MLPRVLVRLLKSLLLLLLVAACLVMQLHAPADTPPPPLIASGATVAPEELAEPPSTSAGTLPPPDLAATLRRLNAEQAVRAPGGGAAAPLNASDVVIVVQVHTRLDYLRQLIASLRASRGIDSVLLVFSHDVYDPAVNAEVATVDFCRVMQIFYPFSLQLHQETFPGQSVGDCARDMTKATALKAGCTNAQHPDKYGHYREARFTQTKHHWWWKANSRLNMIRVVGGEWMSWNIDFLWTWLSDTALPVPSLPASGGLRTGYSNTALLHGGALDQSCSPNTARRSCPSSGDPLSSAVLRPLHPLHLRVFEQLHFTRNHTGLFLFLEEDHYVAPDFLHVLRLMAAARAKHCAHCSVLSLGTYLKTYNYKVDSARMEITQWYGSKHNMGMALERSTWAAVRACTAQFCQYDDYNWDWSLQFISQSGCMRRKLTAMLAKAPRVFHIGECGVHHRGKNCDKFSLLKRVTAALRSAGRYLFPDRITAFLNVNRRLKQMKGNGGWGDPRDHYLCRTGRLPSDGGATAAVPS